MSRKYTGEYLDRIAYPLGGIGAGMICLDGTGAISNVSVRNQPNVFLEPCMFSALSVLGDGVSARVLEAPVPRWKAFGSPGTGNGLPDKTYGLPRFSGAEFQSRYPFASVDLQDIENGPIAASLVGWSPFVPGDADRSSLPMAALEYEFANLTEEPVDAVYSFHSRNFMATGSPGAGVAAAPGGFVLQQASVEGKPWEQGAFCACVDDADVVVDHKWFRGGWFDSLTMAWNAVAAGKVIANPPVSEGDASPGGSLYVPFRLEAGQVKTITLMLCWYVPHSELQIGESCGCASCDQPKPTHSPWYAGQYADIQAVAATWRADYHQLRAEAMKFTDCFFDSTLPDTALEAVEANLSILKSPTILRQTDGRIWAWEGCCDSTGCCHGSCTHVWNYAQALPHLFPDLERTMRETEFLVNQDERGHQNFRAWLPIRTPDHGFHAAADGQLGGIIKLYRDWRISGDAEWLRSLWPMAKASLNYCIELWDPDHLGVTIEPHHNTYDIEFWGADGMCSSIYLGALKAAELMGAVCGDEVPLYTELLSKGLTYLDEQLYNGEYYTQKVQWRDLRAAQAMLNTYGYSPEAQAILEIEGPKYQYGTGCISDGVIGFWMTQAAGLGMVGNQELVTSHLASIYRYNLKHDLSTHANPQRPTFALGDEGGLLLCSWPHGVKPQLPFVYSDEVWTGIEYQVASHCIMNGLVDEGLDIVRTCRDRYDGRKRNPYNEYECGHWYARAMASYALLQALTGACYDAVTKVLTLHPAMQGDFRGFLSTASGYGTVGVKDGQPFVDVVLGQIEISKIDYTPA
ncbi:MAG: GH116 family glycosyl hydrolase [Armatimonadota bacterium]